MDRILILGIGGFIGSNLLPVLLDSDFKVTGVDISDVKISEYLDRKNFHFLKIDVLKDFDAIDKLISEHDIILPLVAIANPSVYVKDPIRVFELDFESNLAVVKSVLKYGKHVVFPSTSEVYGMCTDQIFDEFSSNFITGPVCKQRWIYSSSKQLLDRVIYGMGETRGLSYTIFRPFNWIGPKLDDIYDSEHASSRVLSQFISNILYNKPITLVDGGSQMRCFTYISDGIDGLMKIIKNCDDLSKGQIFNIGNPNNNISIKTLAEKLIARSKKFPKIAKNASSTEIIITQASQYYGNAYQDVKLRVPSIQNISKKLKWSPKIDVDQAIEKMLEFYFG